MKRANYIVGDMLLFPDDTDARLQLGTLDPGEKVGVEITRPRRSEAVKFNAHVHLTLERVAAAMAHKTSGVWTVRNLRSWLCIRTGRVDVVSWPPRSAVIPHSIGDMNAMELDLWWQEAQRVIITDVLPMLARDEADDIRSRLRSWKESEDGD